MVNSQPYDTHDDAVLANVNVAAELLGLYDAVGPDVDKVARLGWVVGEDAKRGEEWRRPFQVGGQLERPLPGVWSDLLAASTNVPLVHPPRRAKHDSLANNAVPARTDHYPFHSLWLRYRC